MTLIERLFYATTTGEWYKEELAETYGILDANLTALENALNEEQQELYDICEAYMDELIHLVEIANFSHGFELALKLAGIVDENTEM